MVNIGNILFLLLAIATNSPLSAHHTDWSSYQFDPQHSGFNREDSVRFPIEEAWNISLGADSLGFNSAVMAGGVVYLGTVEGEVLALRRDSGARVWSFRARGSIHLAPAVVSGKVIFGSADGFLRVLDSKTGTPIWSFNTGSNIHTSPTVFEGRVYFGSNSGHAFALDLGTGALVWEASVGDYIWSSPAVDQARVYLATLGGKILALKRDNGHRAKRI